MTRTDIHRPSAIIPEDYDFVGFRYDGYSGMFADRHEDNRSEIVAHIVRTGGKYASHNHGGSCHVCGANASYLGIFHHPKTNTYICTGEDCADKLSGGDWDAFRKRVQSANERIARDERAMTFLANEGISEAWGVYDDAIAAPDSYERDTIGNIVGNLVQWGSISAKQVAFLRKLVDALPTVQAKLDARKAEGAKSKHVGTIGDRNTFHLTVTFVASYDTAFGTMYVHGMTDNDGNVDIYKGKNIASKGDTVVGQFTIKDHGVREGVNQTILSHPRLG